MEQANENTWDNWNELNERAKRTNLSCSGEPASAQCGGGGQARQPLLAPYQVSLLPQLLLEHAPLYPPALLGTTSLPSHTHMKLSATAGALAGLLALAAPAVSSLLLPLRSGGGPRRERDRMLTVGVWLWGV